jgi:hypothetical protein
MAQDFSTKEHNAGSKLLSLVDQLVEVGNMLFIHVIAETKGSC